MASSSETSPESSPLQGGLLLHDLFFGELPLSGVFFFMAYSLETFPYQESTYSGASATDSGLQLKDLLSFGLRRGSLLELWWTSLKARQHALRPSLKAPRLTYGGTSTDPLNNLN
ncbi:Hypothetical predicted protein [Olea europaea subsp. europaea]|uniref:Uncharacterized protein n=1 Tax=Olea europaea subsp. europaea TaxID=158383 RepID=A0A8S0UXL3_OLEEU|nr:Hypothetical predicted protein [Olea europaea subsp. europaea]